MIATAPIAEQSGHGTAALPEFYRYPAGRLVAVLDGAAAAGRVLDGLAAAGVSPATVQVMSGEDGRRRLDGDGSRHGLLARLYRGLATGLVSDGQNPLVLMDRALRAGAVLMAVPSRPGGAARGRDIEQVLVEHGVTLVWRFGRWTISTRVA